MEQKDVVVFCLSSGTMVRLDKWACHDQRKKTNQLIYYICDLYVSVKKILGIFSRRIQSWFNESYGFMRE